MPNALQGLLAPEMRETPRKNKLMGLLADALTQANQFATKMDPRYENKRENQTLGLLADAVSLGSLAKTAERISYGEPLTNAGKANVPFMKPETADALMMAPLSPRNALAAMGALSGIGDTGAMKAAGMFGKFDRRFDPRVKEANRLSEFVTTVEPRQMQAAPSVSLADFEGMPFITSMSDRTAAGGLLTNIKGVDLARPVDLRGGQDFMFDNNPGMVWASAPTPVNAIMAQARALKQTTGQDPLFMPWRMAPSGGDFAAMTGETMLSFADAAMGKRNKALLDKQIRQFIPEWAGVSNPASVQQFRSAPDSVRKALKQMMDRDFRNEKGGLNIGEARLAVADHKQLQGRDGGLMNVGRVFADRPVVADSTHPSYPRGVPGEGIGRLDVDHSIFEVLPSVVKERAIPDPRAPRQEDLRALQMKPYAGILDAQLLKALGY